MQNNLIKRSLDFACLWETVAESPEGIDTKVGVGGSSLSGGQKQRIALARAHLRNTPVLILDESTSALDYVRKNTIMKSLRNWRRGKTTIIITHDMASIDDDDFMYILRDGNIVAEGYRRNIGLGTDQEMIKMPSRVSGYPSRDRFDSLQSHQIAIGDILDQGNETSHSRTLPNESRNIQFQAIQEANPMQMPATQLEAFSASHDCDNSSLKRKSTMFNNVRNNALTRVKSISQAALPSLKDASLAQARLARMHTARPMSFHQAKYVHSACQDYHAVPISPARDDARISSSPSSHGHHSISGSPSVQKITVRRILATVWPNINTWGQFRLVTGFIAAILHAAMSPCFSYIIVRLFTTFYVPSGYNLKALIYSLVILAIAVTDGIASFIMHYFLESAAQTWVDKLRIEAMQQLLKQPKEWFDHGTETVASLIASLDRNAEEMRNLVGRFAAFIVITIVMLAIAIIWSLIVCWKITLVGLSALPLLYAFTRAFEFVASRWENRSNNAIDHVNTIFSETFSNFSTVRALTLESYFHKKYAAAAKLALKVGLRRASYTGFFYGLSDSAIIFITALLFWFGAYIANTDEFSMQSILTAFSLLLFGTAGVNAMIAYMPQIATSLDTATRLLRFHQLPPQSYEHEGRIHINRNATNLHTSIVSFIDHTFYYATRPNNPALSCLNLDIYANQCTAIIGASGSGKSTITSLLLGFYPVEPSSLRVFGQDICAIHLPTLRNLIGYVPQSPTLIPGTIRENIIYSLPLNSPLTTEHEVIRAATLAGIQDFIASLPQGYNTVIGPDGQGVSGGQAQRLVLARALVRRPSILVLDEPTSALDIESARGIRDSLNTLLCDQREPLTVILITHASEMVSLADRVVVMDRGRVVEDGSYAELLRSGGYLYHMVSGMGQDD